MIDLSLLRDSLALLTRDLRQSFRIFTFLTLCVFALEFGGELFADMQLGQEFDFETLGEGDGFSNRFQALLLAQIIQAFAFLVWIVLSLWMVVAWHRWILLGETTAGLLPKPNPRAMLRYLGKTLIMVLVLAIMFVPIFANPSFEYPFFTMDLLLLIVGFIAIYLTLRFGLVLPAVATEAALGFKQSWQRTRGQQKQILPAVCAVMIGQSLSVACAELGFRLGLDVFDPLGLALNTGSYIIGYAAVLIELCVLTLLFERTRPAQ